MTRRRNETAVVSRPRGAAAVDALIPLIEASWSDEGAKRAIHTRIAAARTGSKGAAELVQAADVIEDANLLFFMARAGLAEALDSHVMKAMVLSEAEGVIASMADAVAVAVVPPEESVIVSLATRLVARRLAQVLGLEPLAPKIGSLLEERFGPAVSATVGEEDQDAPAVSVAEFGA
jgi:hypothetical protein